MKVFLITFILMAYACTIVGLICSEVGFDKGYYKGAQHSRIYHEATNDYPDEAWLRFNRHNEFKYPVEIPETLEPY